jgi:probable rRNA maturation factor
MTFKIQTISMPRRLPESDRKWIANCLKKLAKLMKREGMMVLSFVDDVEMDRLHREHLNIAGTTDVLTFDMRDDESDAIVDVEAVVCVDEAARQAKEHGHDTRTELLLYGLHALLHVTGFDDTTPAKHKKMHAEEDRLLGLIGLGPVYGKGKKGLGFGV